MTERIDAGYLRTGIKDQCLGCEACKQICTHNALQMEEDNEGFRYPVLNSVACTSCGMCHKVCPEEKQIPKYQNEQKAFGGYAIDEKVRCKSTSGGAFSCIVESWCKENYVIFGAISDGLDVYHSYITDKKNIDAFRKSKYSQSRIGQCFAEARRFLREGKNVLFSGTPCQIAGLRKFLSIGKTDQTNLLTVEVVCEGVPSPLYVQKLEKEMQRKFQSSISNIDYRFKDGCYDYEDISKKILRKGRWDFQVMQIVLANGKKLKKDRWFNPFWSIWLNHLMNRPSCYKCPYATKERVADITLGDLWGVHIYCPELYGKNGGSSVMIANTEKGQEVLRLSSELMFGHELSISDVIRYQGPMRKCIPLNPHRDEFMKDLENPDISITEINKKWAVKPSFKLLFSKYIWGNLQKVWFWGLKSKLFRK